MSSRKCGRSPGRLRRQRPPAGCSAPVAYIGGQDVIRQRPTRGRHRDRRGVSFQPLGDLSKHAGQPFLARRRVAEARIGPRVRADVSGRRTGCGIFAGILKIAAGPCVMRVPSLPAFPQAGGLTPTNPGSSRDRTRTYNLPVNSRTLCRLSYAGPRAATTLIKVRLAAATRLAHSRSCARRPGPGSIACA